MRRSAAALLAALLLPAALPLPAAAAEGGMDPQSVAGAEALCREVRRRFLGPELKSYRFLGTLG